MKNTIKIFITILLVLVCFILPQKGLAASPEKAIIGGTFTLEDGEILDEDLIIIGGSAILEEGSYLVGNILLLGGSLQVDGTVQGDISTAGGYIELGETAIVKGDIATAATTIEQDPEAVVTGKILTENNTPLNVYIPGRFRVPSIRVGISPLWSLLSFFAQVFILASVAVLLVLFFQKPIDRVRNALITQPVISGGLGFFTLIVAPIVFVILAITLILLPVSVLGILAICLFVLLGWVALGLEVGNRIGVLFKLDWAAPIAAGVGTLILTFVVGGVSFIKCLGWPLLVVVGSIGLGAVLLTRIGTRQYPEPFSTNLTPTQNTQPDEGIPSQELKDDIAKG